VPRPPIRQPGSVQFAIYDYQRQAWVDLPHAGEGLVVIPAARPYVSPEGPPRLRVTVGGPPMMFRQLDLGLRGRVR
jgi:hypothetical protein